tara:strand:+ start:204 stop:338 length:135 start_codon:yes stop_codon:yes gene_type:complete
MELTEPKVTKAILEIQDLRELLDQPDLKEIQALRDLPELKDLQV